MNALQPQLEAVAREPATRRVIRSWREITGGSPVSDIDRRTLVACSGGADSVALLLALTSVGREIEVGHVRHDLRSAAETESESRAVRALSEGLGVAFHETSVHVTSEAGNDEGNARSLRYEALEAMALDAGCPFVATGHHADDQLETVVMRLLRGAGPGALGGMAESRPLGTRGVRLVRPMLVVSREDARRVCEVAGVRYAEDPTNTDITRLRAAIRRLPLGEVVSARSGTRASLSESLRVLRETGDLIARLADEVLDEAESTESGFIWRRARLAESEPVVLGAALRQAYARLLDGRGLDSVSSLAVRRVIETVGDADGSTRRCVWRGATVVVTRDEVSLRRNDVDE